MPVFQLLRPKLVQRMEIQAVLFLKGTEIELGLIGVGPQRFIPIQSIGIGLQFVVI